MKITYISHGISDTGGYRLEKDLMKSLADELNHCDVCFNEVRFKEEFKGFFRWIQLFFKAFSASRGDLIVTVSRLAWPVYLRNVFNSAKIIIVLHNFDETDGKPRLYYSLLRKFLFIAATKPQKIAIVSVAEYWQKYFKNTFNQSRVFLYPNLFENARLHFFRDVIGKKSNMIHLGQWSSKIDRKAYLRLIYELNQQGVACYFSDNTGVEVKDFPISYFQTYEGYLKQMALSKATVIFNRIDEGWNRVAHESFLVGTQVISTGGGGLGELVRMGNGYLVSGVDETIEILKKGDFKPIDFSGLNRLDVVERSTFVKPITHWVLQ